MFGAKKYQEIIGQQKAMLAEMEFKVTEQNQLYRALYDMLATGTPLGQDSKMKDYVREGYEGNPDIFSIVTKLAGMFAQVMDNVKIVETRGDKEEEVENDEITKLLDRINYYQTFHEFCRQWEVFFLITGNAITYAPRLTAGMNRGKLTNDGLLLMPTQNVVIESGGWRKPISKYLMDLNETYRIDVSDVWHERLTPTLDYREGRNFMGMSPVKVATNIINSQNKGYEVTAKMYSYGHPPGIISKKVESNYGGDSTAEQESKFRERYRTKYQGVDNMAIPIFTMGELAYTKIGYDNLKELDIINMSEHGRRIFCNILQVPAQLFNDTAASTFNNMNEASKTIYTNRLMPDVAQFCAGFNRILPAYGNFKMKPDYSDIEALQDDKGKKAEWVSKMFNDGVITGDDYLEAMGEERTELPEMQLRFMNANRVPTNYEEDPAARENANKFYDRLGLTNGM